MALAERIAAALSGRELESAGYRGSGFTVAAARPGFLNITARPGGVARAAARDPARRNGVRRHRSRRRRAGQCRVRLGQSDRADACRARPRRGGRRRARRAAGQGRVRRAPRVLHQRCRRPGRRAGALGLSALPRGARRRGRADPGGVLSRRVPRSRPGRALAERDGDKWLGRPEAEWLGAGARLRGRRDDAADPRRSRGARGRASTRLPRSASWSRAARSMRRWTRCPSAG